MTWHLVVYECILSKWPSKNNKRYQNVLYLLLLCLNNSKECHIAPWETSFLMHHLLQAGYYWIISICWVIFLTVWLFDWSLEHHQNWPCRAYIPHDILPALLHHQLYQHQNKCPIKGRTDLLIQKRNIWLANSQLYSLEGYNNTSINPVILGKILIVLESRWVIHSFVVSSSAEMSGHWRESIHSSSRNISYYITTYLTNKFHS
jgi:hypothetical protein